MVMYMSTAMFKFLDICNYVRPGTSYESMRRAKR